MNRIDEDLIKRQARQLIVRFNNELIVEKVGDDYHVMVRCGDTWISYNVFKIMEEAIAWADDLFTERKHGIGVDDEQ